ncbi:MAG TPA: STAS domain-containing protein [Acidimicrobiales bacterium]|nr:STAS domain-containing protein [Acidimicrobiales bacterium]
MAERFLQAHTDLRVRVREERSWGIAELGGDMDVFNAPRAREALIDMIQNRSSNVIVDLSEVDFLDSTGLGVLVGALKRAQQHGGTMRLVVTRPQVRKLFSVTGLDQVFGLYDDVEAALDAPHEEQS